MPTLTAMKVGCRNVIISVTCVVYLGLPSVSDEACSVPAAEALAANEPLSSPNRAVAELCPYAAHGVCPYPADQCVYVHGDICDLYQCAVLLPYDIDQRQHHTEVCHSLSHL